MSLKMVVSLFACGLALLGGYAGAQTVDEVQTGQIVGLASSHRTLANEIHLCKTKVGACDPGHLNERVDALESRYVAIGANVDSIRREIRRGLAQDDRLMVSRAVNKVIDLQPWLPQLKQETARLAAQSLSTQEYAARLAVHLDSVSASLARTRSEVQSLRSQVAALEGRVTAAETRITNVEEEVEDLDEEVETKQDRLALGLGFTARMHDGGGEIDGMVTLLIPLKGVVFDLHTGIGWIRAIRWTDEGGVEAPEDNGLTVIGGIGLLSRMPRTPGLYFGGWVEMSAQYYGAGNVERTSILVGHVGIGGYYEKLPSLGLRSTDVFFTIGGGVYRINDEAKPLAMITLGVRWYPF